MGFNMPADHLPGPPPASSLPSCATPPTVSPLPCTAVLTGRGGLPDEGRHQPGRHAAGRRPPAARRARAALVCRRARVPAHPGACVQVSAGSSGGGGGGGGGPPPGGGGGGADASCMLSTAPACARACRHGLASAFAFCVPVPCHHGCPLRTMHHRLQALVQSGTVFMLSLSVRHSLRFRGQLFCQLVGLFSCCRRSRCALGRSSQGMARAVGCLRLAGTRLLCCHLTQTCPLVVAGGTPQGPIPAAAAGDATAGDAAAVGRRLSAATGSALLAGQAAPHGMRSARCEGAATACSSGTATRFRRHVQQRRRRAAAQLGGASVPLRSTGRAHGSNNAGRLTITAELEKS